MLVGRLERRQLVEHIVLQVVAGMDSTACADQQISRLDCNQSQILVANFSSEYQEVRDKQNTDLVSAHEV